MVRKTWKRNKAADEFVSQLGSELLPKELKHYRVPFGAYRGRKLTDIPRDRLESYHAYFVKINARGNLVEDFMDKAAEYLLYTME